MIHEVFNNSALVFWPVASVILFGAACFFMVLRSCHSSQSHGLNAKV